MVVNIDKIVKKAPLKYNKSSLSNAMKLDFPHKDCLSFSTISIGGGEEKLHLQIPGDQIEVQM